MSTKIIKKINCSRWMMVDATGIIYICRDFKKVPLRPFVDARGRKYIRIDGRTRYVHRLVAEAFIPNPGRLPRVEFIKGISCSASNLRWARNMIHRPGDGKKLSLQTVRKIKALLSRGDTPGSVARTYRVHRSLISHIKAGRRWKNV